MILVRVGEAAFDVGEITARLNAIPGVGGVANFVGIVRDDPDNPLAALVLEAYPGMTERVLIALAETARDQFGALGVVVEHRTGRLPVSAPIVLVACASAHRHAALDACAFLMDCLKTGAPLWKKEIFRDGTQRWVDAKHTDDEAAARWTSPPS